VGNRVARKFGIAFCLPEEFRAAYQRLGVDLPAYNGDERFELPIPATYVVAPEGVIADAYVNPDYTERMAPAQIIATLSRMRAARTT
jgi:peroxiredoxin